MKQMHNTLVLAAAAAALLAMMPGCSTPEIPITMNVAGEVKLAGVSKFALVDFNSLPEDPFTGTLAADAETCALVQRTVASAFYKTPTYQVANLTREQAIAEAQQALPNKRFDALIYGRVWWQITPETDGEYPKQFTLKSWNNVPYTQNVLGVPVPMMARVTTQKRDVLRMLPYRNQTAALMLSLSIYRVDGNGNLTKLVDTYQVTEQGFTLMNGKMKLDVADLGIKADGAIERLQKTGKQDDAKTAYELMHPKPKNPLAGAATAAAANAAGAAAGQALGNKLGGFGGLGSAIGGAVADSVVEAAEEEDDEEAPAKRAAVDANGKVVLAQESVTMPTELQAKLMLAARLSDGIVAKMAPSEVTFSSPWVDKRVLWVFDKRFDAKLTNLLEKRAWGATKDYAAYVIRQKVGKEIADTIACLGEVPATYPVAPSEEHFEADETQDRLDYLADEEVPTYLYALALAQEATGDLYGALDTYTEAFGMKPDKMLALGISRCNLALGQAKRLNETAKAKKQAERKTKLD